MDNFDYASNSHKSKEAGAQKQEVEREKAEPVVKSSAKVSKKSFAQKCVESFIPTRTEVEDILETSIHDFIVPSIKETILDTVAAFLRMDNYYRPGSRSYRGNTTASKTSYSNYYNKQQSNRSPITSGVADGFNFDNLSYPTRTDAEKVLNAMNYYLERYGSVTLEDYYALSGISNNNYQAKYFGWIDLDVARIVRSYDGYRIDLPRAVELEHN